MGGTGTTNCGLALVWHQRRRFLCVFSPNHRTHPHKRFPGKRPFIAFFREGRAPSRPIFYPLLPGWEKEVGRHGGRPSLNFSRFLAGNSVHVAPKKGAPVLDTRTRPLELEFRGVEWMPSDSASVDGGFRHPTALQEVSRSHPHRVRVRGRDRRKTKS